MPVQWIDEAWVLVPERQPLYVVRHVKRLTPEWLEVMDVHVVLLETLSRSEVEITRDLHE